MANQWNGAGGLVAVYNFESITPGGNIVASASSEYSASYPAWKAFDKSSSPWRTTAAGVVPCWVALSFGTGHEKIVASYTVRAYSTAANAPKDWILEGYDGSSWHTLDSQSDQTGWGISESRNFTISNTTAYEAYRLSISANNGGTTTDIYDLYLYGFNGGIVCYDMPANALLTGTVQDLKGSQHLTAVGDAVLPTIDTVDFKAGSGCIDLEKDSWQFLFRPDHQLSASWPLKYGTTNYSFFTTQWVKAENLTTYWYVIWSKDLSAPTDGHVLYVQNDDLYFYVQCSDGWRRLVAYDVMSVDRWFFIAAGWDNATKVLRLYVWDDTLGSVVYDDTYTWTGAPDPDCTGADWIVGGHVGNNKVTYSTWDGKLDEMTIWNRALTTLEIELIRDGLYQPPWQAPFYAASSMSADLSVVNFAPLAGRWTWPTRERLTFHTEILASHDRTEQRIAHHGGIPRQTLGTELFVEGEDVVAALEAILHGSLKQSWPVPVWPMAAAHTANLPAGSSAIAVDTRYADFRADSWCLIWQRDQYEVVRVASVADAALTLARTTRNACAGPKWIVPCRLGWLTAPGQLRRYHGGALVDLAWEVDVGDLAAVTGFVADMTYDGMTVLSEPAYWPGDHGQASHDPDVAVLDTGSGPFSIVSNSTYNEVTQSHVWHMQTKARCWWLRQFLHSVKGPQGAFLVPTFRQDLVLTRPVGAGETSLYVANRRFASQMGANALRTYLAFRPPLADIVVRKVTGVNAVSSAEELITINAAPGQVFPAGAGLCWVDKCRLAQDAIDFEWTGRGELSCSTQLTRIP